MQTPDTPAVTELLRRYPDAAIAENEYQVSAKDFAKHVKRHNEDGVEGGSIGIIWLPDGRIPLVRRTHSLAGWALPSGGIERGDSYLKTFTKEMHEEVGVAVVPESIQLVLFERQILVSPEGERYHQTLATFAADIAPGQEPHATQDTIDEGLTIGIFAPDDLPELIFSDRDKILRAVALRAA